MQLKSDAKEPFEKLDCSAVVRNVRFCSPCFSIIYCVRICLYLVVHRGSPILLYYSTETETVIITYLKLAIRGNMPKLNCNLVYEVAHVSMHSPNPIFAQTLPLIACRAVVNSFDREKILYRVNLNNVPTRTLRYLRNARIFLYQISAVLFTRQPSKAVLLCAVFT